MSFSFLEVQPVSRADSRNTSGAQAKFLEDADLIGPGSNRQNSLRQGPQIFRGGYVEAMEKPQRADETYDSYEEEDGEGEGIDEVSGGGCCNNRMFASKSGRHRFGADPDPEPGPDDGDDGRDGGGGGGGGVFGKILQFAMGFLGLGGLFGGGGFGGQRKSGGCNGGDCQMAMRSRVDGLNPSANPNLPLWAQMQMPGGWYKSDV